MSGLGLGRAIASAAAGGSVDIVAGTVVTDGDGTTVVTHQGAQIPAEWLDSATAVAGATVLLAVSRGQTGQSSAVVLGTLTSTPRPLVGKIMRVSGPVASVQTETGTVQALWTWSAPTVGQQVRLMWQGPVCSVIGTVGATTPSVSGGGVQAPDQDIGAPMSGTTPLHATASGSWTGARRWTGAIIQGTQGSTPTVGGWAYGAAPRALAGATVTSASLLLTGRSRSGSYDQEATLHVSCHAQAHLTTRPEQAGPTWQVTVPPAGGPWPQAITVPTEAAQWVIDHAGGLMVSGGAYAGVLGIDQTPDSGLLTVTWNR